MKINLLLAQGENKEAETLYLSVAQRFPKNDKLHYSLAKFYAKDKKFDQAEEVLKKLVNQLPEKEEPKYVLIEYLMRQRGVEVAENELETMIKENPDNFGYRFAKLTLYKDQPEKIRDILEKIIEDDKALGVAGINARNKLAQLLYFQGDTKRSRELVEEVLENDTKNSWALLFRANMLNKEGDFDAAIADARTILRGNPESEKAMMVLALAQLKTNNIDLAEETLEKALLINSNNKVAAKELARIKVIRKDDAGAIEILEKARNNLKDVTDISIMLVDLYGKQKEWQKAEDIANELLEKSEDKTVAHFKLAQLYMAQTKFKSAVTEFKQVLESKPTAPDALAGLVNCYIALKQVDKAENLLDNALLKEQDKPALMILRAELHKKQQQYADAERLFKRVVDLNPKVELGYKNLVSVYLEQKQFDKAITVYQQGLKELPESVFFLMQTAYLNTYVDDMEKAQIAYESLLAIAPDNLLAINNLAAILVESPDPLKVKKAEALIGPLKDSEYLAFMDTYGWVSFKNGKVDEALNVLKAVIKKEGVIPEMYYHLGMIYIEKGQTEEAKLHLEKAVVEGAKYNALDTAKAELKKLNAI